MPTKSSTDTSRGGRPQTKSQAEVSHIALELFRANGFEETTMDDIARKAGIGRRTLFRYFESKNDLPWGDFETVLAAMRENFARVHPNVPVHQALRDAVVDFNEFPPEETAIHRERMKLLLNVPALQAHSTLRYAEWREIIAEFVATRTGKSINDVAPQAVAHTCLGLALTAYEKWLVDSDTDLSDLIIEAFDSVGELLALDD